MTCEMQGKFILKPGAMTYAEEKLLIFFGQVRTVTLVPRIYLFYIIKETFCVSFNSARLRLLLEFVHSLSKAFVYVLVQPIW